MYYISNYRYLDIKGIVFANAIFADLLLVIILVKFDQLGIPELTLTPIRVW